ncbi:uncharacterized protein LACBIDRAFT_310985 [Laccaria bicolor S238N-H82]|uniref:Predicted protein n=1 Tax=Laccaria bicolor (strain S238N-H82 / ATCC MYA-4686) TaxID=486041 RepID=B0DVH2_LACBS|nr:uncharacterized protein LACBIDRAFT_310985 [Laccaria bicolor S238N-H82]EDR01385.1 predicted protein [Laccaria bicolor S238N-H82]|eukprot:XP_001887930.1 predicted protein [Laccaria bicolor S238N-H82]
MRESSPLSIQSQDMELSFQVSVAGVRISNFDPAKTSSSEAVARYISDVEKKNDLEEGTLRDAIIASTPFGTRLWETTKTGSFVPQPAPLNMRLEDAFGNEGGTYLLEVKPEFLKYFLVGSPASVRKKNKNKKKKKTKRADENGKVFVCIFEVSRIYHFQLTNLRQTLLKSQLTLLV